jgi:23S rRNA (cytosine1962-C5)-methyltransferase
MLAHVYLKKGKEQSIKRFHPWVFSGAILSVSEMLKEGQLVEVYDHSNNKLGLGHFAEGSIAVRVFSFGDVMYTSDIWFEKIAKAYDLRVKANVVNEGTNLFRLIHGEGDGMPGLIVDIYEQTAVLQFHGAGMRQHRKEIAQAIKMVLGDRITSIYDKSSEKLKGAEPVQNEYVFGKRENDIALEHGLKFKIDWETGQKTGFFIDQRENRKLLGEFSKGKKVLNTFCYSGGFSLYALREGAELVHSLDSSASALQLTDENVKLNGFDETRHACIQADAVNYIKDLGESYDVIVLDPPAFAKHLSARHKAIQGYKRINEAAIKQIKPGGVLFTFSCSQVIDKSQFTGIVLAAAIGAGREVRILHQLHQGPDHPVNIFHPEGEYLKGLVLEVI